MAVELYLEVSFMTIQEMLGLAGLSCVTLYTVAD